MHSTIVVFRNIRSGNDYMLTYVETYESVYPEANQPGGPISRNFFFYQESSYFAFQLVPGIITGSFLALLALPVTGNPSRKKFFPI